MKKTIKKTLCLILSLVIIAGAVVSVSAADVQTKGRCGNNVTYTLYTDGALVIQGHGPMDDYNFKSPFKNFNVKYVKVENGITRIGDCAFMSCHELVSAELPETVTSIGFSAFESCTSLVSIKLPDSVRKMDSNVFSSCESLKSVNIPMSLTDIYMADFSYTAIETVVIPKNIKHIWQSAFEGCDKLTDVYYAGNMSQWNNIMIEGGNQCLHNAELHINSTGDVDSDGKITSADARMILRNSVSLENFSSWSLKKADADNNGQITAADARAVLRTSVNLSTEF